MPDRRKDDIDSLVWWKLDLFLRIKLKKCVGKYKRQVRFVEANSNKEVIVHRTNTLLLLALPRDIAQ